MCCSPTPSPMTPTRRILFFVFMRVFSLAHHEVPKLRANRISNVAASYVSQSFQKAADLELHRLIIALCSRLLPRKSFEFGNLSCADRNSVSHALFLRRSFVDRPSETLSF